MSSDQDTDTLDRREVERAASRTSPEQGVPPALEVWRDETPTGTYLVDAERSSVTFRARALGVWPVTGELGGVSGTVHLARPREASEVHIRVDADSLDTGNALRDAHLRSRSFLDTAHHDDMTFGSDAVRVLDEDGRALAVRGSLTVRGMTIAALFTVAHHDVWFRHGDDGQEIVRSRFLATAEVDRRAFDIPRHEAAALWGVMVARKVDVTVDLHVLMR